MEVIKYPARTEWASLLTRPTFDSTSLFDTVQKILDEVHTSGDKAVMKFTKQFDKVELSQLEVTKEEMHEAELLVSSNLKQAIKWLVATFGSSIPSNNKIYPRFKLLRVYFAGKKPLLSKKWDYTYREVQHLYFLLF